MDDASDAPADVVTTGAGPLIAHVIFRLDTGGLENGLVNLLNRIPDDRYRHAVVCLTDYTEYRRRLRPGISVHALHKRPGKDLPLYGRLWWLFRRLRPDIVHTRNLVALESHVPAWAAGVTGHVHGEHGYDIHDVDGSSRKYRLLRRALAPLVGRFIPLSGDLERYLLRKVGIPARKVQRICNGVDTERFHPAPERGGEHVVIGSVGRMEVIKDPLNLVEAFLLLRKRLPYLSEHLRLVHLGDGSLRQQALDRLMRRFDVFALPSRNEGISNTILEAMASGLPVVATDVGGNAELVEVGACGAVVPHSDPEALAEALEPYVMDEARRRTHGEHARRRAVERFSMEAMVSNYLAVYDAVCPKRASHDA